LQAVVATPSSIRGTVIAEGFGADGLDFNAVKSLKETLGAAIDDERDEQVLGGWSLLRSTEYFLQARVDINVMQISTNELSSSLGFEIHVLTPETAKAVDAALSRINQDNRSFTAAWGAKLETPPSGVAFALTTV
jgi:hypothetical protein